MIEDVDNEEIVGLEQHGAGLEASLPRGYVSVSQISQFMKCGRAYEFRYVQDIHIPRNSYMAQGTSLHKGAEALHLGMIAKQTPLLEAIRDAYADAHTEQFSDPELIIMPEDIDAGKIKDVGIEMIDMYYAGALGQLKDPDTKQLMRAIRPVAAERAVKTELFPLEGEPVPFLGILDLEEEGGVIRDLKTKRKAGAQSEVDNSLQLTLYAYIKRQEDEAKALLEGEMVSTGARPADRLYHVAMDQLIKPTKKQGPRYMRKVSTRTDAEMQHGVEIASSVATDIAKGRFPLTMPDNWWCTANWCPYWDLCRGRKR